MQRTIWVLNQRADRWGKMLTVRLSYLKSLGQRKCGSGLTLGKNFRWVLNSWCSGLWQSQIYVQCCCVGYIKGFRTDTYSHLASSKAVERDWANERKKTDKVSLLFSHFQKVFHTLVKDFTPMGLVASARRNFPHHFSSTFH